MAPKAEAPVTVSGNAKSRTLPKLQVHAQQRAQAQKIRTGPRPRTYRQWSAEPLTLPKPCKTMHSCANRSSPHGTRTAQSGRPRAYRQRSKLAQALPTPCRSMHCSAYMPRPHGRRPLPSLHGLVLLPRHAARDSREVQAGQRRHAVADAGVFFSPACRPPFRSSAALPAAARAPVDPGLKEVVPAAVAGGHVSAAAARLQRGADGARGLLLQRAVRAHQLPKVLVAGQVQPEPGLERLALLDVHPRCALLGSLQALLPPRQLGVPRREVAESPVE
eukprot:CAMPEP_0179224818 /NCGR_PEP_ID=MMETSP0797-20121207/7986_1 /TAXON_ID=47934 /ORGANISM="Dinophysis acuminata, Strain DAEP01" /LENGTH=275 /DNA_ID=CAMNT_0020931811 /DNA_START=72 /DNA_END=897 /DNA_ORIENTATION=-